MSGRPADMAGRMVLLGSERMPEWDEFVGSHEEGSVYHTSAWRSVVEKSYGHEPLYFVLVDGSGRITAGIPVYLVRSRLTGTRLSTLPCAQSCNPLVSSGRDYEALKGGILEFMAGRRISAWELKTTESFPFEKGSRSSSFDGFLTHELRVDRPLGEVFASLHKGLVQRNIKKGVRNGLVLRRCASSREVGCFFRLYSNMRCNAGLLPQPRKFFDTLWSTMASQGMIDILYAEYQGRTVSTAMLLKFKDTVVYEYGATENGAHRLGASPFLLWEAIKQSSAEGYRTFNFGRTAAANHGLSSFKERWGTRQAGLRYYQLGDGAGMAHIRQNGGVKAVMEFAMRALPELACRLSGRMLYKHLL